MKLKQIAFLTALAFAAVAPTSYADTYSYNFLNEFSGGTPPDAAGAWATLSFTDLSGGGVSMDLSLSGLTSPEFASEFFFNFGANPGSSSLNTRLAGLTFTLTGGQAPDTILRADTANPDNVFKADGDGYFDVVFVFPTASTADKFGAGEHSVYTITGSSVTAADFSFPSLSGGGNGTWYAALHVQNTGVSDSGSGWIGATPIPEPETYAMLLAGLGLMGFIARRRKMKAG